MKAVEVVELGNLKVVEQQYPKPKDNQVILKIRASGVCGSDIPRTFKDGPRHYPIVLGHEFAGEVVEVGKDVSEEWLNKQVAVYPLIPCMECPACLQKDYVQCKSSTPGLASGYSYYGSREDGGFKEYLAVNEFNLVPFRNKVTYTSAAMLEPLAVSLHAVRKSQLQLNESIIIFGAGAIGLLIARWAELAGAKNIIIADISDEKVKFCKKAGFKNAINVKDTDPEKYITENFPKGIDVSVEASGSTVAFNDALRCCDLSSRVVILGNPHSDMTIKRDVYDKFMRKECRIISVFNSIYNKLDCDEWKDAADTLASGKIQVDDLVTHKVSIENVPELFNDIYNQKETICKGMMVID